MRNKIIATGFAGLAFAGGAVFGSDTTEKIIYVPDPVRVVQVLNSIDLTDEMIAKLAPKDANGNDLPVDKILISNSPLEKYWTKSILEGKPPVLGGTLNSWEMQEVYKAVAKKNNVFIPSNFTNGTFNLYDELRK